MQTETVTVTREQFRKIVSAVAQHLVQCRQEAHKCESLGLDSLEAAWLRDAEVAEELYQQVWSL